MPAIDVLIPHYGSTDYLPEALASVALQQQDLVQCVFVVDDHNPTPLRMEDLGPLEEPLISKVRIIRHDQNKGQAAGRNTAANAGTAPWLALLDADDIWMPEHLSTLAAHAENTDAGIVFSSISAFDEKSGKVRGTLGPKHEELHDFVNVIYWNSFVAPSAAMVSRKCFESIGGFDESRDMRMVEDHDFWLNAVSLGIPFQWTGTTTVRYRIHDESSTGSRSLQMMFNDLKVLYRHRSIAGLRRSRVKEGFARLHWLIARYQFRRRKGITGSILAGYHLLRSLIHHPGMLCRSCRMRIMLMK